MSLKNKIVLVTGGNGFLGKHLMKRLFDDGCHLAYTFPSSEYNLLYPDEIKRCLNFYKPDNVIHLAAVVGGIGANMNNPGRFFYENAVMGIHLIEECRKFGIEKMTIVGTICAYPKFCPIPFNEKDLWNGYPEETNAPYGLAKKMLLVQSQAYRQEYGFNSIYLLPVNLYGEFDHFDPKISHVIPAIIKKMVDAKEEGKKEIVCWGTGSATREFLYAGDCADGIIKATESYEKPEPVNLGSGVEISIKNLTEKIADIVDFKGEIIWDTSKPDGQPRRCLDVSKAKEEFGFEAKTSFDDGLKKTIDWYILERNILNKQGKN